ncbi:MAG: Ig-like domain-containing protein [Marinicellaceae bacterium]
MKNILISLLTLIIMTNLNAAVITVDRNDDLMNVNDGGCDLRDAVNSANFNLSFGDCTAGELNTTDFIILDVSDPIQLSDEIDVLSAVSISAPIFSNDKVKIIAAANERIFEVHPSSENSNDFQMIKLHLQGGDAGENDGGAVVFYRFQSNDLGDINIINNIFEDNSGNFGGAIAFDQTYASSITIEDNVFLENEAENGGALSADRASLGEFKLSSNQFQSNSTIESGGLVNGGAAYLIDSNDSTYLIQNNQFTENSSQGNAGALDIRGFNANQDFILDNNVFFNNSAISSGGALSVGNFAFAVMYNSTIGNNTALNGGGIYYVGGRLDIRYSTIVHNNATQSGDNIFGFNGIGSINRSIVAYPDSGVNCAGNLTGLSTGTSNIMDDRTCPFNPALDIEADPLLSDLDNDPNGFHGYTPLINSDAIDTSEENNCRNFDGTFMIEDQQGNERPIDSDSNGSVFCDSGAIEAPIYSNPNQAAVANDDFPNTILEDATGVTIDVLANDTDAEGDNFIIINTTNASHGNVMITNAGQNVSYTPNANYCGSDSFNYTITGNDTAEVSLNIACINDEPIAINDQASVLEDSNLNQLNVIANDTDIDTGENFVESLTQPNNAEVINQTSQVSYTPDANYCNQNSQTDDFNYTLNGGSTAVVEVEVLCVNDQPSFSILGDVLVKEENLTQSQLIVDDFASDFIYGPNNESSQQVIQFDTMIESDESAILQDITVNSEGRLVINFTENVGVAIIHLTMQDDGGVENGGDDTSEVVVFYVTYSDNIFSNGFETNCCFQADTLINTLAQKYPNLIAPRYDEISGSIEFYGYVLELTESFPNDQSMQTIKQWLNEIVKTVNSETVIMLN